jgi:hypothetical protein
MFSDSNYTFYNTNRVEDDATTKTQNELQNGRFSNYTTTNYFSENSGESQIKFATEQPAVVPNSNTGSGVGGDHIDSESTLKLDQEKARHLGRLNLMQRQFNTVPYLGRGSVDPTLELQLLEGEPIVEKKSTSTIMSQSFMGYTLYPTSNEMEDRVSDPKLNVEESAMNGWVRGGADTRVPADCDMKRPGANKI